MIETLLELELPSAVVALRRRIFGHSERNRTRRIVILAGLRGDTPEGVRVCHRIMRFLESLDQEAFQGQIELVPCINPIAAHHGVRHWPPFELDLNRRFPGRALGHLPDRVVEKVAAIAEDAEQVIELRGAHPAFREEPQALVALSSEKALERALLSNVRFVWRRSQRAAGSLAEAIPELVELEGGCGNRLTNGVGEALRDGVLNMLAEMGVIPDRGLPFHWAAITRPAVVVDAEVVRIRADAGGLFHPAIGAGQQVQAGSVLGEVVEPFTGELLESLESPVSGTVLAIREQPVVYPGTLVARVVEGKK